MSNLLTLAKSTLSISLLGSLLAQNPALPLVPLPTRGVLPTMQVGMVFSSSPGDIALKGAGRRAVIDQYPGVASGNVRDFTAAALSAWVFAEKGVNWTALIDGISTSNDNLTLVFDSSAGGGGIFRIWQAAGTAWAMLNLSLVGSTQVGGADVVGYYFDNPGFPSQLRTAVYFEHVIGDYRDGQLLAPTGLASIEAMDAAMGLIEASGGRIQAGIVDRVNELYFTLTPASAQALHATGAVAASDALDGATILVANYDPQSGLIVDIEVQATGGSLGLPEGADIDALAMGFAPVSPVFPAESTLHPLVPGSLFYVLSLAAGGPDDQLFVVAEPTQNPGTGGGATTPMGGRRRPLHNEQGKPLLGPAGTLTGNVKSACAHDPESLIESQNYGVPRNDNITVARSNLSLFATEKLGVPVPILNPNQFDSFDLHGTVSGWGQAMAEPSLMFLWIRCDGVDSWKVLPTRGANDHVYDFTTPVTCARNQDPTAAGRNFYMMSVCTVPLSNLSALHFSVQLDFTRRQ